MCVCMNVCAGSCWRKEDCVGRKMILFFPFQVTIFVEKPRNEFCLVDFFCSWFLYLFLFYFFSLLMLLRRAIWVCVWLCSGLETWFVLVFVCCSILFCCTICVCFYCLHFYCAVVVALYYCGRCRWWHRLNITVISPFQFLSVGYYHPNHM